MPELLPYADGDSEVAAMVARIRALMADGVAATEIAILVRTNAQLVPFEAALTASEIPFTVRGVRFFARPEVRAARAALKRGGSESLVRTMVDALRKELGFDEADPPGAASGAEARDRHAALATLLGMARSLEAEQPGATVEDFLAELARRDATEADAGGDGVTLSTLHRAKGLEWDAVFLPGLEDGTLPIRQSSSDADALAEERRLLYVGITRARRHLVLSWAGSRLGGKGPTRARASRFMAELWPNAVARPAPKAAATFELSAADEPLLERLIEWRRLRARADGVPAYVVADNKTLAAIAVRRPSDAAGLLGVPGIGQRKVAIYGDEILAITDSA
jgi:DNA helicase-2/ATP-dependent DNA helicase PcrA